MKNTTTTAPSENTLNDWRVIYYSEGSEDGLLFRCQAEDVAHALEQFNNAEPKAMVCSIVREDTARILPGIEGDFEMSEHGSGWISLRNASIFISDHEQELVVTVFPRGREDSAGEEHTFRYSDLAASALLEGSWNPNDVYEDLAALHDHHLLAHLAELDVGSNALAVRRLKLYALLVPTEDIGTDTGSAIVAPLPLPESSGIKVHFESNRYGAENLHRFIEKTYNAADRADTRYPTAATAIVQPHQVKQVAIYCHALRRILEITDEGALHSWAGHIGDHTL